MLTIKVAARNSPLSIKQVLEVERELKQHVSSFKIYPTLIHSKGDLDLKTSLLYLEKTDFFTKEVDDLVKDGICDVSIHSAKDLPETLDKDLEIYALTKGVDSCDVLVLREGETLKSLKEGALIGTSSLRRLSAVSLIRKDFTPKDIRGTIQRRIELLQNKEYDAVIIAKAALIRLDLLHLNFIELNIEVSPLQGRLAVVGKKNNIELKTIFSKIDHRG